MGLCYILFDHTLAEEALERLHKVPAKQQCWFCFYEHLDHKSGCKLPICQRCLPSQSDNRHVRCTVVFLVGLGHRCFHHDPV